MDYNFYTAWNPPPCPSEEPGGDFVVDASGYLDSKTQIENLIAAGHNLMDWRKSMYANEPTPDDIGIDDTLRKDFDFQDAHEAIQEVSENVRRTRKKALEAAEAASKASAESDNESAEKPSDPKGAEGGQPNP